jgi:uncharacterized protein YyaL (SSP411 family)
MISKVGSSPSFFISISKPFPESQISLFYDSHGTGAFFSTHADAPHVILRLKDGMDTSEPSTNGVSASNLYRLSSLLDDETYAKKGKETVVGFESEMLQYPWLFASFMPSIVASHLGVKGVVVSEGEQKEDSGVLRIKEFQKQPRGGLGTFAKLDKSNIWLRERNSLLKDFGLDGKGRILVCENGACHEEGLGVDADVKEESSIDLSAVAEALPVQGHNKTAEVEESGKDASQVPAPSGT